MVKYHSVEQSKNGGVANHWWLTTFRMQCHDFHIPVTGCLSNWSSLCFRLPWNLNLPHWMEMSTSFLFLVSSWFPFLLLLNTEHPYSGSKDSSGLVALCLSLLLCVSSLQLYLLADCETYLPRTWPCLACFSWCPVTSKGLSKCLKVKAVTQNQLCA